MNNNELIRFHKVVLSNDQDELQALNLALSLPKLNYIDIFRQERLTQMMTRWPLLAEMAQKVGNS